MSTVGGSTGGREIYILKKKRGELSRRDLFNGEWANVRRVDRKEIWGGECGGWSVKWRECVQGRMRVYVWIIVVCYILCTIGRERGDSKISNVKEEDE